MDFDDLLRYVIRWASDGFDMPGGGRKRRKNGWKTAVAAAAIAGVGGYVAGQAAKRAQPAPPIAPPSDKSLPPPPPLPVQSNSPMAPGVSSDTRSVLLLRAMVAAANADHEIDDEERARIFSKADFYGLSETDRRVLHEEFDRPATVAALARGVGGDVALGRQVYLLSLLVMDLDSEAERAYLDRLAKALAIPPSEVRELHERAEI